MATPCYNCKSRQLGCHSNCENYKEFQNKKKDAKKKQRLETIARCTSLENKYNTKNGLNGAVKPRRTS